MTKQQFVLLECFVATCRGYLYVISSVRNVDSSENELIKNIIMEIMCFNRQMFANNRIVGVCILFELPFFFPSSLSWLFLSPSLFYPSLYPGFFSPHLYSTPLSILTFSSFSSSISLFSLSLLFSPSCLSPPSLFSYLPILSYIPFLPSFIPFSLHSSPSLSLFFPPSIPLSLTWSLNLYEL